jgi:capsular polysaccharide biosynthesis protein
MNPSQRPDSLQSVDYTGVLRRRWWIVLAGALIGLVGALVYVVVAPKTYTATATVNVVATGADQSNTNVSNSRTGGTVNLDTEAQLVTSGTVTSIAAKMMHSTLTVYQLSKQVSVTVPPNSTVLTINCSTSTAASAAICANDFAKAYLQNRQASAASALASQAKILGAKIASLNTAVSKLNTSINGLPKNSSTRATDMALVNSDRTQIGSLNRQLSQINGQAANVNGGSIITAATPPGKPSSPKKSLILPSGLVAGLLIGLIVAFVWDRRDKRLHNAPDVERLLDLPVMLSLPRKAFGRQVTLASPRSRTGRAFTELAHTVAASLGEGSHILLVAGSTPGPGVSVVAANLAATLARTHSEAVLVCADLRDSVAPELFGLVDSRGLAEVVAGRATVGEVARGPAGVPGLWVIPPGADASLADYQLQHDTAKALTSQLRRDARYVIIEALATDDGVDTFAFAEFADAALLTVEIDKTDRNEAGVCIRRLHRMRTPILGAAVLPPINPRVSVRPPQPAQPRLGSGPAEGRDGAVSSRTHGELSALSGTSAGASDGPDRPARSRDGYGDPADRVPGR